MKRYLLPLFLIVVIGTFGSFVQAEAQTIPWDTDAINGTPPTACADGSAITFCPITGYRLQVAPSTNGTFTDVLPDTAGPSRTLTGVAPGQHCYRLIVLSANGPSAPSNVACTTTVKPTPVPGPATLTVDSPVAFNVTPNFQRFVFERGARYKGKVNLGASCDVSRSVGDGFYVISRLSQVSPRPTTGTVLVAHCSGDAAAPSAG